MDELQSVLKNVSAHALAEKIVQVELKTSSWGIERKANAVSAEAAKALGVSEDDLRSSKYLINKDMPEYKACTTVVRAARAEHNKMIMPHPTKGWGWLPSERVVEYIQRMQKHIDELAVRADQLAHALPAEYSRAAVRLNSLYDANDYPRVEVVKAMFYIGYVWHPTGVGTQFDKLPGLSDQVQSSMADGLETYLQEAMRGGLESMWRQLQTHASTMQATLTKPKPKIFDGTWATMLAHVQTMKMFNLTGDETYATRLDNIERVIQSCPPAAMRASAQSREDG